MRYLAEYLFEYLGIIAFAAGLALLLADGRQLSKSYGQVRELLLEQPVAYTQKTMPGDMGRVEREELAASLMTGIPYDVIIDGTVISAASFHPRLFDYTSLGAYYRKEYVLADDGTILQIRYTGIGR